VLNYCSWLRSNRRIRFSDVKKWQWNPVVKMVDNSVIMGVVGICNVRFRVRLDCYGNLLVR